MAFSSKFMCLFFFISLSLSFQSTYARESQFFSKVTPNTKDVEFVHLNKQDDHQQRAFIPQTTETGGYGLYDHDTGLNAPSTTTTATTLYNMDENNNNNNNYDENNYNFNNNNNYDENNFNFNNNNNNYDEKNYVPELKGLSSTNKYFSNNNNYGKSKYYGAGYNGGDEKQGMSDTRFLENGKYFYDLNAEKNFDANNNNYMSYSNNNYNNNGYYGNKENKYEEYYNNNNNKNNFYSGYGRQGYQNHFPQEEFDFDQP